MDKKTKIWVILGDKEAVMLNVTFICDVVLHVICGVMSRVT